MLMIDKNPIETNDHSTILNLLVKPFETEGTQQNRTLGLFAMIDQVFSEQHNPRSYLLPKSLKIVESLLSNSHRLRVAIAIPKNLNTASFIEAMHQKAVLIQNQPHKFQTTTRHAALAFSEAFITLYRLIEKKLKTFEKKEEVHIQQLVAHNSYLAQAFHSFRSCFFTFCRLFYEESLARLKNMNQKETEEKLESTYSSLLDEKVELLAVI
jgi:predicted metal-dependent hydrolase